MGLEVIVQSESMHAVVTLGDAVLNGELELELEQLIVLPASSKQSAMVVNEVGLSELVEANIGVGVIFVGQVT